MYTGGGAVSVPRRTVATGLAVATFALLLHNYLVPFRTPFFGLAHNGYDLETYRAAVRGLWDGRALYDAPALNRAWFVYPPFAALALAPLSLTNFEVAKWTLVTLSLVALALLAWRILRLMGLRADIRLAVLSLALAVATIDLEPVQATLWWGQINIVLMAMVLLDLWTAPQRRWRGAWLGVAAGIKLTPLVFLPYLLLTRQWRASAIAASSFAATVLLTWSVLPGDSARFWSHLGDTAHISRINHLANQSINGFLARFFFPQPRPAWLWVTLSFVVFAAALFVAVRAHRSGDVVLALVVVGLMGCAISPFSWAAHWVWFAPAVMWLAAHACQATGSRAFGWAVCTIALYAMTFMWTLHRPGRAHTTIYFSGVYWKFMDVRALAVGQLMSGWYPLTFLCFMIGVAARRRPRELLGQHVAEVSSTAVGHDAPAFSFSGTAELSPAALSTCQAGTTTTPSSSE